MHVQYNVCVCLVAMFLVPVFSVSFEVSYTDSDGVYHYEPSENIRDKRTLGIFLKSFADAFGYDVQKRPSVLPLTAASTTTVVPVPAAPAPAAPAPAPKSPAVPAPKSPAAPATPAPTTMAPAPAPAASTAAPAPAPPTTQAKAPTAPPLLTETIQKMFNINFNWNRNVQTTTVAPTTTAAPASTDAPATTVASASTDVPATTLVPAPATSAPVPAPVPKAPAVPKSQRPAPKSPRPASKSPAPAPGPAGTPRKATPTRYRQQQLDYQDNVDYADPQQIVYYSDYQEINQPQSDNQVKEFDFPNTIQLFWQNSPWNRNNKQYNVQQTAPDYQEYITPDGYHVRQYHQHLPINRQDTMQVDNSAKVQQHPQSESTEEEHQQSENSEEQQQQQYPEDENVDSSRSFAQYYNDQPRGFQPVYQGSESRFQSGYQRPGLPIAVHGIHEDKVLVAWPSPFESAETKIKKKKVAVQDRMHGAASANEESKYIPESYDEYNFYTVPEPKQDNYKAPSDPKIEEELSPNAKVFENNYGKRIVNLRLDKNTYKH